MACIKLKRIQLSTFRVNRFKNGFTLPLPAFAMWLSGVWPFTTNWLYISISVLSTLSVLYGEVIAVVYYWPDIAAECNVGSTIITGVRSVFLTLVIFFRRERFMRMIDTFVETVWVSKVENKEAYKDCLKKISLSNWVSYSMIFALTGYLLIPLIDSEKRNANVLPFLTVYPFDIHILIVYSVVYALAIVAGTAAVFCVVGHDTLMNYMLLHTCRRLKMLSERIENINKIINENKYENDLNVSKELKNITQVHCKLISFVNTMEGLFSPHILLHFFGTSILTCILGVQLLLVELTVAERTKLILYFITCLGQIYVSCKNGERLIENSSHIGTAIYNINWPDVDSKFRANVLMIIQRSQKPLKLTAGKFFDLSMETFSSVLKTAGSYYALLKNLLENHDD